MNITALGAMFHFYIVVSGKEGDSVAAAVTIVVIVVVVVIITTVICIVAENVDEMMSMTGSYSNEPGTHGKSIE